MRTFNNNGLAARAFWRHRNWKFGRRGASATWHHFAHAAFPVARLNPARLP